MMINTNQIVSITEANQNLSKVVRLVEQNGSVIIFKQNRPRYQIVDVEKSPIFMLSDDEKIEVAAKRILEKYLPAFKELAK